MSYYLINRLSQVELIYNNLHLCAIDRWSCDDDSLVIHQDKALAYVILKPHNDI